MTIAERLEQKGRQEGRMEGALGKSPGYCVPASENGDDAGAD